MSEITKNTKILLLDHAEKLFSELGYTTTSMRQLTEQAGTDLGSVRYHFGSKIELYRAVMSRRLEPLCHERIQRLDDAVIDSAPNPPAIDEVARCFFEPIFKLMVEGPHGATWVRLISRSRSEPDECNQGFLPVYEKLFKRYLEIIRKILPELPLSELQYRLFFAFGMGVSTFVDGQALKLMGSPTPDVYSDPDRFLERMVQFASAGLAAPFEPAKFTH